MVSTAAIKQLHRETQQAATTRRSVAPVDVPPPLHPWQPLPGPQTQALHSKADIIGYGGQPGGGKTDLLLGAAGTLHWRSIIFRRVFPRVRAIIERSREIFNAGGDARGKDSFNEQLHRWQLGNGRMIEFGSMQYEGSKKDYQGRAYDLHCFDELTEFSEAQFRFVIGWNRTTRTDVQPRVIATFNPPLDDEGMWVVRFFAPWLDPDYAGTRPKPGELVWYVTDEKGKDQEVGRGPVRPAASPFAKSRTFIPASLADNPYLLDSGYEATLQSLPEPMRSILLGKVAPGGLGHNPWQVIPRAWVKAAQQRWRDQPQPSVSLSALGVDVARGGQDQTVIAKRYGTWLAPLVVYPGTATPDGQTVAGYVMQHEQPGATINVDVIGVGSSVYDQLSNGRRVVQAVNVASGVKGETDRSGTLTFRNLRAWLWWHMRQSLDPETGDGLALPDDDDLLHELCMPRWSVSNGVVKIEDKDEIRKRLGASPDRADAVVLTLLPPVVVSEQHIASRAERVRISQW